LTGVRASTLFLLINVQMKGHKYGAAPNERDCIHPHGESSVLLFHSERKAGDRKKPGLSGHLVFINYRYVAG